MNPRIIEVKALSGHRLAIRYDDGLNVIKDLNHVIEIGNLAAALADESFLRQVQITERGRSLLWPNGLEFCADALRIQESASAKLKRSRKTVSITA